MSFESCLSSLLDPNAKVRASQLVDLTDISGGELGDLAAAWPQIEPDRRLSVINELADLAEDNVELNFDAVYKNALSDSEPDVRAAAIGALVEYEGSDLIPVLIEMLRSDPAADVRAEAAIGLGRFALAAEFDRLEPSDADAVRLALSDSSTDMGEDEAVRARAIEALGAISGDETRELIESVYDEGTLELRIGAVDAMGRSCDEAWLPIVLQEMASDSAEMRFAAAFAAGSIGDEGAVPSLSDMAAQDPDHEVQVAAVRALGEIGGRTASVALKNLLYEGDDTLQEAIEEAMADISFADDPLRPEL